MIVALQTPTVEPPLVSIVAAGGLNAESKHHNKHQKCNMMNWLKVNSEREEDPLHDCHMPEKASWTLMFADVAQWAGQQNPYCVPQDQMW